MHLNTTKITSGASVILLIVSIVMGANLLNQENVYVCEERGLAMICDKLSSVNKEGIQTRCYFFSEDLNKTSYKVCSSGWIKFEKMEVTSSKNNTDFVCGEGKFIKECVNNDGQIILRVKNE